MRLLICTDVAARGIDIHGVPYGEEKFLITNHNHILDAYLDPQGNR